jgi:hypothetical protein
LAEETMAEANTLLLTKRIGQRFEVWFAEKSFVLTAPTMLCIVPFWNIHSSTMNINGSSHTWSIDKLVGMHVPVVKQNGEHL